MSTSTSLTRWEPVAHAVLRIVAGLIFLEHGTQKFLGFPAGDMAGAGRAFDNMGAYAGVVESAAGLLIALGLFTRPAAFVPSRSEAHTSVLQSLMRTSYAVFCLKKKTTLDERT